MEQPKVYICHSQQDNIWKDRLINHLRVLEQEGVFDIWDYGRIDPGQNRYQKITNAIIDASLAVLLISTDFLCDESIKKWEIPALRQHHEAKRLYLYPVIVRPCGYTYVKWLSNLQVRPKNETLSSKNDHDIEVELSSIAAEIAKLLKDPNAKTDRTRYIETDRDRFSISEENPLPIFNISLGAGIVGTGGVTKLNFLTLSDYEQAQDLSLTSSNFVIIDREEDQSAKLTHYILEIDQFVKREQGIGERDWLLIRTENDPGKLEGKTVALLAKADFGPLIGLRTFFQAEDHYFLAAQNSEVQSTIVMNYSANRNIKSLDDYYNEIGPIQKKKSYQVRIIGEVVDFVRKEAKAKRIKSYFRQMPIVNDLVAAGNRTIPPDKIAKFWYRLNAQEFINTDYFGVAVTDNSMIEDGIVPGQICIIDKTPSVKAGEIAVIVIIAPNLVNPLGVLKRYYVVQMQNDALRHWLLASSNPASKHIVVMPHGSDIEAIKDFYMRYVKLGKIVMPIFVKNGELVIVGKFISSVPDHSFTN